MKIPAGCPKCGAEYSVDKKLVGKKLKCRCGDVFSLSPPASEAFEDFPSVPMTEEFLDEISEELEKSKPDEPPLLVPVDSHRESNPEPRFEMKFPMDPIQGMTIYKILCVAVIAVMLALAGIAIYLLPKSFFIFLIFAMILGVIFLLLACYYSVHAHEENQTVISITREGISIRQVKKLPWPCWDQKIPIENIEDARIERATMRSSMLLANAEPSHVTYTSNRDRVTHRLNTTRVIHVFVYHLQCDVRGRPWTSRLATIVDRSAAKTMRLHLKRMLSEE
jgi:hypothetical protein